MSISVRPPRWFVTAASRDCERCPERICETDPAAWLPATDEVVCACCGNQVATAMPPSVTP